MPALVPVIKPTDTSTGTLTVVPTDMPKGVPMDMLTRTLMQEPARRLSTTPVHIMMSMGERTGQGQVQDKWVIDDAVHEAAVAKHQHRTAVHPYDELDLNSKLTESSVCCLKRCDNQDARPEYTQHLLHKHTHTQTHAQTQAQAQAQAQTPAHTITNTQPVPSTIPNPTFEP